MTELTLYQFETCPFCAKVRDKIEELGMTESVTVVNVSREREDPQRQELFDKTGKWPVPVLKVDDEYIAESDVIIKLLEEKFSKN